MTTAITKNAAKYRLEKTTTPENLELRFMGDRGHVVTFGEYVLVTGYYYNPGHNSYYAAVYKFATAKHNCEGRVDLITVSEETFVDDGHALMWAMSQAK